MLKNGEYNKFIENEGFNSASDELGDMFQVFPSFCLLLAKFRWKRLKVQSLRGMAFEKKKL